MKIYNISQSRWQHNICQMASSVEISREHGLRGNRQKLFLLITYVKQIKSIIRMACNRDGRICRNSFSWGSVVMVSRMPWCYAGSFRTLTVRASNEDEMSRDIYCIPLRKNKSFANDKLIVISDLVIRIPVFDIWLLFFSVITELGWRAVPILFMYSDVFVGLRLSYSPSRSLNNGTMRFFANMHKTCFAEMAE